MCGVLRHLSQAVYMGRFAYRLIAWMHTSGTQAIWLTIVPESLCRASCHAKGRYVRDEDNRKPDRNHLRVCLQRLEETFETVRDLSPREVLPIVHVGPGGGGPRRARSHGTGDC